MNIDSTNPSSQVSGDARRVGDVAPRARVEATPKAAATDPSATTNTARLDASRDIDSARVTEIRQAIKNGSLDLQPRRIADGILASARELVGE